MKLFMIRHGQSEANIGTCYTGQKDVKLTELGMEQAAEIRPILAKIPFDKVYCSDLIRTAETCKIALPGADPEYLKLLREFDVGSLVDIDYRTIERIQSDDPAEKPDYTHYGGENAIIVGQRLQEFLRIIENSDYECVAAFTHYGIVNCMLRYVTQVVPAHNSIDIGNCSVHAFEFDGEKWRVLAVNYMRPLF